MLDTMAICDHVFKSFCCVWVEFVSLIRGNQLLQFYNLNLTAWCYALIFISIYFTYSFQILMCVKDGTSLDLGMGG